MARTGSVRLCCYTIIPLNGKSCGNAETNWTTDGMKSNPDPRMNYSRGPLSTSLLLLSNVPMVQGCDEIVRNTTGFERIFARLVQEVNKWLVHLSSWHLAEQWKTKEPISNNCTVSLFFNSSLFVLFWLCNGHFAVSRCFHCNQWCTNTCRVGWWHLPCFPLQAVDVWAMGVTLFCFLYGRVSCGHRLSSTSSWHQDPCLVNSGFTSKTSCCIAHAGPIPRRLHFGAAQEDSDGGSALPSAETDRQRFLQEHHHAHARQGPNQQNHCPRHPRELSSQNHCIRIRGIPDAQWNMSPLLCVQDPCTIRHGSNNLRSDHAAGVVKKHSSLN